MKIAVAVLALAACAHAQVGSSGIISPDGRNVQFTHDFAQGVVLIGPSGIVGKNGNLQLTHGQAELHNRAKRSTRFPIAGASGMIMPDGTQVQFTRAEAENIAVVGPAGIVKKDGKNVQFREKRSLRFPIAGASGMILPDGTPVQYTQAEADNIAVSGPSGIVRKDGNNVQFIGSRKKRSITAFGTPCLQGPSGLNCGKHGLFQIRRGTTFANIGNSGIVNSDGVNFQFTP